MRTHVSRPICDVSIFFLQFFLPLIVKGSRTMITDHDPAMIMDHGSRHDPPCPGSRTMDHAMNQPQDHRIMVRIMSMICDS